MLDEFGRLNNRAQAIKSLDKLRMAHLFNDMQKNQEKYPSDINGWLEWLNKDSGDSVTDL